MKSIGQIIFESGACQYLDYKSWEDISSHEQMRMKFSAASTLKYASAIIRERAETDTKTWAARDEWLRVADLLESLE